MNRILITGGAGFIGYNLVKFYATRGDQVTIVDNLSRGILDWNMTVLTSMKNVKFIKKDLTRKIKHIGKNYDLIYHLAGVNGTKNFYEYPSYTSRTNLLTLINTIDWVVKKSPKSKFIWTSSSEVYACNPNKKIPTPEDVNLCIDDISNPRFSYASSKIAGESIVNNCGLDSVIIRPHNIYASRMGYEHVIPEFIMKSYGIKYGVDNDFKIQGTGKETRAFCYVDDFIEGLNLVSECGKSNETYNIGNDKEEISIMDLAKKIIKIYDIDVKIKITKVKEGSVSRRCPDISKMRSLGYEPQISLDEGLRRTIEWYT